MMPEIITCSEAKARGLKRYFTGKPCKRGHFAERYLVDGQCLECQKVRWKRSYTKDSTKFLIKARKYQDTHRDKVAEKNANYRKTHRDKILKRSKSITDLLAALRITMPDLLKEFGL